MIDDPYKVLGIPSTASMDEVKKAYRQKAKQYHPDMHPDDPKAAEKMNQVNEAYDMIMNPEKYARRRAEEQQQQQARQGYGGYGGYGQGQSGGYGGYGGFGGVDFEEIFRQFYGASSGGVRGPQHQAGDPPAFVQAVNAINNGQYQQAIQALSSVASQGRNGRWYYLAALANLGAGNRVAAYEYIARAVAMEPGNGEYAAVQRAIGQNARSYQNTGRDFRTATVSPMGVCAGLCLMQMCCPICRC